jgi:two-component system phosphate regulon sensor histidine kinase PhoR
MKKGHIRILVVVMSVALIGLLAVQWFWVRNAVALREKQFQHHVLKAMENVAERLQDQEIAMAISNGRAAGLPFLRPTNMPYRDCSSLLGAPTREMPSRDCSGLLAAPRYMPPPPKPHWLQINLTPTQITQHQVSRRRLVDGAWISENTLETTVTKGDSHLVILEEIPEGRAAEYAHGFVERMLRRNRPIYERLDLVLLDTLIKLELDRRGIQESYVYDVRTEGYVPNFFRSKEQFSEIDESQPHYKVQLFPHDIDPAQDFLLLQFPDHASPTMRAMGLVLPTSGILIVIVMACFGIALVAFRRQQKLSDLKTDFINNMTHELKTPISTISLALEALGDPDMQTQDRIALYARVIGQENERLKSQVERVLQAAALERGELKLDLQPVDVDLALCEQIERIRLHVEGRGGKISYQPDAKQTTVLADEVHLGGMLFNLLDNANKYSPDAPQIEVITRNVPHGIAIDVRDHGLGIATDAQRNVFEKFYRVPTGNVHDVKGFGIGLSYARSMARAHGGDITLVSEAGIGSTFTLFIPQKSNLE